MPKANSRLLLCGLGEKLVERQAANLTDKMCCLAVADIGLNIWSLRNDGVPGILNSQWKEE